MNSDRMNKVDTALSMFSQNHNCAQSVLGAFTEEAGIDEGTAERVALGFGAGMGRLQNTCGALTGAFMVLGLMNSNTDENSDLSKEKLNLKIQKLARDFESINGSLNCRDLLGCNINSTNGMNEAKEKNYFNTKCTKYIEDVINLLEEKYL